MDVCIHNCEMSGQLRASESFSYFRVEIVGPIFLSFLKEISQIFRCSHELQSYKNLKQKACHISANNKRIRAGPSYQPREFSRKTCLH